MLKRLSFKIKRVLILASIGVILVSILTGFAAIEAANGITKLAENTVGEVNFEVIWAIIMLWIAGGIDILMGFGIVILGGIWVVSRL